MSAAARTGIKWVGKMSAVSLLASAVLAVGRPAVAVLFAVVIVLVLTLCWVLNDTGRSYRLEKLIKAIRGRS